jgi:hypothetical protein
LRSRCHRIGQTKTVTVYKLVARATVDEDIFRMQERKSQMNAAIMESHGEGSSLSNSSSDFDAARERENVLKDAVDRYLRSPRQAPPPPRFEEKANTSAVESNGSESGLVELLE